MKLRIGINGFGRIGRAIFRNNLEKFLIKEKLAGNVLIIGKKI